MCTNEESFSFASLKQSQGEWSFEIFNDAGMAIFCFGLLSSMSRRGSCISSVLARSPPLIGTKLATKQCAHTSLQYPNSVTVKWATFRATCSLSFETSMPLEVSSQNILNKHDNLDSGKPLHRSIFSYMERSSEIYSPSTSRYSLLTFHKASLCF